MLTLALGSSCDVCAEEYGPQCLPHSIPCGHVLCASCCTNIAEKTPARLSPTCPFCRVGFTSDSVRVIRTDFMTSGWTTPRRMPPTLDTNLGQSATDLWTRKTERLLQTEPNGGLRQDYVRRLEDKVARVASKKCSVEEVSALHNELEAWLNSSPKHAEHSGLFLSCALLRAILTNHVAHSEASKAAKTLENNLRAKLDEIDNENSKLDAELRRQRSQHTQKAHEVQNLRTELTRIKVVATNFDGGHTTSASDRAMSPPPSLPTPAPSAPGSPTTSASAQAQLRAPAMHVRSASMHAASRPTTPAVRSHTPAPSSASRAQTPAPARAYTPAPVRSSRTSTPAPAASRSQTPGPNTPHASSPLRSRRVSSISPPQSPPRMDRSISEEKKELHERWIPPASQVPEKYASLLHAMSSTRKNVRSPSPHR